MSNYIRNICASVWSEQRFRRLNAYEIVFYFYLHTSHITSDTSVFKLYIDEAALYCKVSAKKIKDMIDKFISLGLILYDFETEEVLVLDYFENHEPAGGLTYEMFIKDLNKIKSEELIRELAVVSKSFSISLSFFAALQEIMPDLQQSDYKIKSSNKSIDEIKTAAVRGRKKITENRNKVADKSNESDDTVSYDENGEERLF